MRFLLIILLTMGAICMAFAQKIERKIIIENNQFYFTTIDEDYQLATLHKGNISESIKETEHFALPAGRNFDVPVNPFSWDISKGFIYAINFLVHPLNDRNESIKKIDLNTLQIKDSTINIMQMLMTSADFNTWTMNEPYMYITKQSNTLNNFFFDAIYVNDSSYCMAIANNGKFSIWNYNGKTWNHSEPIELMVEGYFSLFKQKNKIYILFKNGNVQEIGLTKKIQLRNKKLANVSSNGILIENRDQKTIRFLKNQDINAQQPFNELINDKAIELLK